MPVPLHTIGWGSGARRILLLHGITANAAGWWRVGPDLAERGWEVVATDLRGHGDSPKPGSYLFAEHVADVLALGTGWDAVLGHSMGGTISVLAATEEPRWTAGLVLQDPALMLPEPMSEVLGWLLEEYELGLDPDRIAAANPRWHPEDVAAKVEALHRSSAEIVRSTTESNWNWMVLEEANALEVPTVIIGSDPVAGGILPVTFGEWLAESPWIEYVVISNSSHSFHRDDDQYDTYLSTLVDALDRLPTLGG
ncbi:MAG: alpha/beta fold hydrolase [Acidimicrobiia bacterium]